VVSVYGKQGELTSPTDAEIDPTGSRLFVADSPAHKIVVFDAKTAEVVSTFGRRGNGDGEFNYPTSLAFDPEGNLFVVDQLNARVQMFEADGEYVDQFGERGLGFGNLNRPKDIAIDETGFIYVTDFAFNNVQLFDVDFALLTFVGSGGTTPGKFHGASGVAVRGDEFAVVDQLGRRVQVFRFIVPKED
jgi:DNA-binding beta-propeller fold protein YncE